MPQHSTTSITDVSESRFYSLHQTGKQMYTVGSDHCLVSNKFIRSYLNSGCITINNMSFLTGKLSMSNDTVLTWLGNITDRRVTDGMFPGCQPIRIQHFLLWRNIKHYPCLNERGCI